ncbi:retrovirus-related pol polyprotein from transposon TNT 1-94 [Tanacetum coccineum]
MPLALKTQNDSFAFVHELKQEMHADLKYIESLEDDLDELESDKAEFSNMYDTLLQECVSKDVMCSYLQSSSDLDEITELQCLYLHKVRECDCLAQKLSEQTEFVSKEIYTELLRSFAKLEKHSISLEIALQECQEQLAKTITPPSESPSDEDSDPEQAQKDKEMQKNLALIAKYFKNFKINRLSLRGLLAQKEIDIKEGLKVKACEISIVKEKHDELVKQSLLTKSHYEGLVKEKTKVITDLKLKEEKDIDKMISMENQIKFLNEIVYKRSQSIQTIHMLAPKCPTFNGRPTFANPRISKMSDLILQECVSKDVMYSYLQYSSDLDEITELQCLYLHKIVQLIIFIVDSGCTKHMTGNLSLLCNFVEKYLDLVQENITIKRVYYVEGLNHNLFSVGQFCDADLEVAFRKSTCFVRDLQGNDLLTGNRGTDLNTISLQETTSSTPICLMAKASPTQAWLWHRRLSHLNFDYINLLLKKDDMIGLPKLKYVKDQLCSFYEVSKAKRSSFKSKTVPSSKGRLNLLHMDLCGPMRVASINRKKYILVIIDDYSKYTWTLFLRSKDETPKVLTDFLTMIQRNLQALVISVRTDRGTEFLNKTLNAFFKEEGIKHQTSTPRTPEPDGVVKR